MAVATYVKPSIKVADQLYLTLALLHREQPGKSSFSIAEVIERAKKEGFGRDSQSLRAHAYGHAAANLDPKSNGRYRIVFREENKTVRLLQKGDYVHPDRHMKMWPLREEVPDRYHELLDWAKARYEKGTAKPTVWLSGLLGLRGVGKELWKKVDAEQYIAEMREGWE